MKCDGCVPIGTLAGRLNVRTSMLWQLIHAGKVDIHDHDGWIAITKESGHDLLFPIAVARAGWGAA